MDREFLKVWGPSGTFATGAPALAKTRRTDNDDHDLKGLVHALGNLRRISQTFAQLHRCRRWDEGDDASGAHKRSRDRWHIRTHGGWNSSSNWRRACLERIEAQKPADGACARRHSKMRIDGTSLRGHLHRRGASCRSRRELR